MDRGTWEDMIARVRVSMFSGSRESSAAWHNRTRRLWLFGNVIYPQLYASVEISDHSTLAPVPNLLYCGYPVFRGDGHVLFASVAGNSTWIYRAGSDVVEPHDYLDLDGETWIGDAYYESGGLQDRPGATGTLYGRGTLYDSENPNRLTMTLRLPRWEKNTSRSRQATAPCGIYEAFDQTADDIVVGIQTWRDQKRNYYYRSLEKDETGHYRYNSICWNQTVLAWTPEGDPFVRSSAEPNQNSPVTFLRYDAEGNPIATAFVLSFYGLTPGRYRDTRFFAEACVYR